MSDSYSDLLGPDAAARDLRERTTADGNVMSADSERPRQPIEVEEEALSRVRTALAELQNAPVGGLSGQQRDLAGEIIGQTRALERMLTNEVSQQRTDGDPDSRDD